ncbi:UNVERIFIED_CONTAM: hypothetical protein Sradi_4534100 [Sesamum radiatum]|uniref:Uncharacterized protein n=1 Tax=Sesamum radiatum TaxID=300843 RepID=A0AAW2NAL1_SESRA
MDELEHIEKEIVALKRRRTSLCATLKGKKQLNHDAQAKVHEVEKDIAALESTGPLDDTTWSLREQVWRYSRKTLKSF